jgi:hypothetical protein
MWLRFEWPVATSYVFFFQMLSCCEIRDPDPRVDTVLSCEQKVYVLKVGAAEIGGSVLVFLNNYGGLGPAQELQATRTGKERRRPLQRDQEATHPPRGWGGGGGSRIPVATT